MRPVDACHEGSASDQRRQVEAAAEPDLENTIGRFQLKQPNGETVRSARDSDLGWQPISGWWGPDTVYRSDHLDEELAKISASQSF